MQLSTRGRYAVMAMVDLATRQTMGCECGPICLAEIAARQRLSLAYLEQLFGKLRRAGLVALGTGPGRWLSAGALVSGDRHRRHRRCGGRANPRHPMRGWWLPGCARGRWRPGRWVARRTICGTSWGGRSSCSWRASRWPMWWPGRVLGRVPLPLDGSSGRRLAGRSSRWSISTPTPRNRCDRRHAPRRWRRWK